MLNHSVIRNITGQLQTTNRSQKVGDGIITYSAPLTKQNSGLYEAMYVVHKILKNLGIYFFKIILTGNIS